MQDFSTIREKIRMALNHRIMVSRNRGYLHAYTDEEVRLNWRGATVLTIGSNGIYRYILHNIPMEEQNIIGLKSVLNTYAPVKVERVGGRIVQASNGREFVDGRYNSDGTFRRNNAAPPEFYLQNHAASLKERNPVLAKIVYGDDGEGEE